MSIHESQLVPDRPKMHHFPVWGLSSLALSALLVGCANGPEALIRNHAYEGPTRVPDQLATVFSAHRGVENYLTLICEVDGKSFRRLGVITPCPSVVYLTPGMHRLSLQTQNRTKVGSHQYDILVEAARTYEIVALPVETDVVTYNTRLLPAGHVLTYRDIGPFFFTFGNRSNATVPQDSN